MTNTQENTHSIVIGYVLWIFGFTGSHRFYYGRPITGCIWFFTFGLLGIGWLVDVFLIPGMDKTADLRYSTASGPMSYNVTWILLVFLGLFGVHRFYLGKYVTGAIWFFTGGFFVVGYLYDLLTLNDQIYEANAKLR